MAIELQLVAGTLDDPNCFPATPQALYLEMFAKGVALLPNALTGVIMQDATPGVTERGLVWIRTSGGIQVQPPVWTFVSGQWIAVHPVPIGHKSFHIGTLADITTLDGGSAGVVSYNTGPFWEVIPGTEGRFLLGAGTLASGAIITNGSTGGEENHVLTQTELPSAWTNIKATLRGWRTNLETIAPQWLAPNATTGTQQTNPSTEEATFNFMNTGGDQGHNNLPPYYGVYWIRRTARTHVTTPIV